MALSMERRPDLAPHPASQEDLDGFEVLWAAEPGPIPEDVARDLRELSDAVKPVAEGSDGIVGTRFGRRVVVAPVNAPDEAVDIADVDPSRSIVLTMGAKDPTPQGALLAQVLTLRTDVLYGFANAPDIEGPTLDVLQQLLPALQGSGGAEVEGIGRVAVGRHPQEVRGAVESLKAQAQAADDDGEDDGPEFTHA